METLKPKIRQQDILTVHSIVNNPKKLESIFKDYQNKIYLVSGRYETIPLADDELWTSEAHDRSWLFWHHCLVSVAYLIDAYNVDRNEEKLKLALSISEKWYEDNYPVSPSVMGWHDHSTALRLLHLTKLYVVFLEEVEDNKKALETLKRIAVSHIEKLVDEEFYMPKHNHGMDQDISLYIAATVLEDLEDRPELQKLAFDRFWEQVSNLFAVDGCYLEHSPHYIYLLADRLLGFYKVIYKTDQTKESKLRERIEKVINFFIDILQPDGNFPTIGDSELQTYDLDKDYWKYLPQDLRDKLFIIKGELEGQIDLPVDSYYPDGGYAIFRNNWENDLTTNQLVFYSAFHSRVHKHHDDLSFTIYGHGIPLLIDAGKFTYEYERPERTYVTSSYGHNTIRLNNTETVTSRLNIEKSGILSYLSTKNIGYASGFHALTDNVTHRRMIFTLKPEEYIILDLIRGPKDTDAELIFNFNPDLITAKTDSGIVAFHNSEEVLTLESLLGETDFMKHRGEVEPLKGWSSNYYGEIRANDLLSKQKQGSMIKFATYINLKDEKKVEKFEWQNNQINFKWRNFNIEVVLTDYYEHILINGKYFRTVKNFHKTALMESLTKHDIEYFKSIRL